MCRGLIYFVSIILLMLLPGGIALADMAIAEELLVDLRAEDLAYGEVTTAWPNRGTLGDFLPQGTPVIESIGGLTAVAFDGSSWFDGPTSTLGIEGVGTRSIEVWAYNPQIVGEETMVSWAHRGGPCGTNIGFNYSSDPSWGAVGHWCASHDMGWWGANSPAPAVGQWWHLTYTYDGTTVRLYVNGEQESVLDAALDTHSGCTIRVAAQGGGGSCAAAPTMPFSGYIAEVRIHDGVLSAADIKNNFRLGGPRKAHTPDPADGATGVLLPLLSWKSGDAAMWHDVYLGTNPTPGAAEFKDRQPLAYAMWYEVAGWIPGETYYWRIDEVEADGTTTHTGDVWSFTAASSTAYDPDPPDGAKYVDPDKDLSWSPGATAVKHDVYFGTDETEVTDGTGATFKVNQPETIYDPGTLAKDTRYYWRIDGVEGGGKKYTGEVWTFKTLPDIPITDPDLLGWWKFDEGSGTIALDWSGHGDHGTIRGDPQWVPAYGGGAFGYASADSIVDIPYSLAMAPAQGDPQWAVGYDGGALEFDGIGDHVEVRRVVQDDFTLMAWIKTDTPGLQLGDQGYQGSGLIWSDVGGVANDFILAVLGTKLSFFCGNPDLSVNSDRDIVTGEWVHVAATRSAVSQQMAIYIDGQQERTAGHANTGPLDAHPIIAIGGNVGDSRYYTGLIDEVRAYQKTLTGQEIKQAMRGDPLLAWNPQPANGSTPDIDGATPVSWSPGDEAAKHDVYFGTDRDAVEDADTTTTGIYRGRQDPNTYTPPEGVEFGQSYHWRIDEYNTDGTISDGKVWSFAVADYLIVDDFESYDDYCMRIFYIWGEGWGHSGDLACGVPSSNGNGTGSTVGYLAPPYAEQTIVNGGRQAMPMEFLNDGSTGKALYSETERTFDPAQDWTRHDVKALTLWFRGVPASVGSFGYDAVTGIYTMTAAGADIWDVPDFPGAGPGNFHDEFHYGYKRLSGVGNIVAQALSVANTDGWAKAGVMIRETLDANSVHAMVVMTPGNGVAFQGRTVTGGVSFNTPLSGITAPHWVRLTRSANTFTGEHSADGTTWEAIGTQDIPMAAGIYIGLALTSHNTGATCEATFSDVSTTGTVTGQWQSQDIGIASNVADQLYVAVEDSTGKSKVVNHPDPDAVLSNAYQEWNIDLEQVSDAGVNLQSVKKMYIGVGDRDAPKLGGAGMLYIDDIRLYQPRCFPSLAKSAADFNSDCVISYPDLKILTNDWLFAAGASGLNYEYYEGDWDLLPDFDSLTTALVGKVDNFDISVRTQNDYFGFRFTGQIDIATAGDYTFYTESDDGSQLYIGDTLVVDNDGLHGMVEQSGTINLTAGMHPITVTMFEKGGGEGLNVQYEGPQITKGPIPDAILYRQSSLVDLSGDGAVDFEDYALLADMFLDELLWP